MGPNEAVALRAKEKAQAEALVLDLTPKAPDHITYKRLWAAVLTKHAVRVTDLNAICASLKKKSEFVFLDWEAGKRKPEDHYRMQRPVVVSWAAFPSPNTLPDLMMQGLRRRRAAPIVEPLFATRHQCSFFGHSVSSFWWLSWQPAIRRLLQRVSRARRAYPAKGVHRDLLAPPEFQLLLSVRRLTCV
jgi:hypothetical protein